MTMKIPIETLRAAYNRLYPTIKSENALASALGIQQATLSRFRTGAQGLSKDNADTLTAFLKEQGYITDEDFVEVEYHINSGTIEKIGGAVAGLTLGTVASPMRVVGRGFEKFPPGADSEGSTNTESAKLPEIDFVERVKARPITGNGGLEVDGDCVGHYSFHTSFLSRKGGRAKDFKIFQIDGDSMEPILHAGDLIMVNLRDSDIRSGHIYLIRLEDELMVKRLEKRPGGKIFAISENDRYKEIEIDLSQEGLDFKIFGRMVWLCREF